MARPCKCFLTGEKGTTDVFFKTPTGKYCKSEELYKKWEETKTKRYELIDMFAKDFLGYEPGAAFPTNLPQHIQKLEWFYGVDCIAETIDFCRNNINYALETKEFKNDAGKVNYIFAIIKNNINDVYRKRKSIIEKKTTVSYDPDLNLDEIHTKHKEKNLSKWLGDEDWI